MIYLEFGLKQETEIRILILMYGLLDSLEKDIIPLYLTTRAMFSPYGVDTLKEVGIRSEVIDLVDRGRELDDIFDLIPHLYKKKGTDMVAVPFKISVYSTTKPIALFSTSLSTTK